MLLRSLIAAWTALLVLSPLAAPAQTPAPSPVPGAYALIPYQEPQDDDPHAAAVTVALAADLAASGVTVTTVDPVEHLDAVRNAAQICASHHATALLVPDGRVEQTLKRVAISLVVVLRYPTHAELRLDEVGCDGIVHWSSVATGDEAPSGMYSVGNLGAAVDGAYRTAAKGVSAAFAAGGAAIAAAQTDAPVSPAPTPGASASYLVLPFAQPKIEDPYANDITHSFMTQLEQRKIVAKPGASIDALTVIATAPALCAQNGVQGIIVPAMRIEQSSFNGRSHGVVRLALVNCDGTILAHAVGDADMGASGFITNFGARAVGVAERAMIPALDRLFPSTKPAT